MGGTGLDGGGWIELQIEKLHPERGSAAASRPTAFVQRLARRGWGQRWMPSTADLEVEVEVGGAGSAGVARPQDLLPGGEGGAECGREPAAVGEEVDLVPLWSTRRSRRRRSSRGRRGRRWYHSRWSTS